MDHGCQSRDLLTAKTETLCTISNYTPNLKLECFVYYLKIINTSLKNNMHLEANRPRNSKRTWNFSMPSQIFSHNSENIVSINNSRNAWPTEVLSSLDNLLLRAYIIFQKGADSFEIEHKTC